MTCHGMSVRSVTHAAPAVIVLRQNRYCSDLGELAKQRYVSPANRAAVYLGLGEKEKALDWLEKAYDDRDPIFWWINGDQLYDSVRDEPRFKALVQKVDRTKAESRK